MEFWLGRWKVAFAGPEGEPTAGSNTISKHAGRIYELFVAPDDDAQYVGASVTRRSSTRGLWVQEYWDNQGYRAWYEGGWDGDRFILAITGRGGHQGGSKRLVWHGIREDSMQWDNERTADGGVTWTSTWHIDYARIDAAHGP